MNMRQLTINDKIDFKVGQHIKYCDVDMEVTHYDYPRISFKTLYPEKDGNWSCGNIPLYEHRPGNRLTNIELIQIKTP